MQLRTVFVLGRNKQLSCVRVETDDVLCEAIYLKILCIEFAWGKCFHFHIVVFLFSHNASRQFVATLAMLPRVKNCRFLYYHYYKPNSDFRFRLPYRPSQPIIAFFCRLCYVPKLHVTQVVNSYAYRSTAKTAFSLAFIDMTINLSVRANCTILWRSPNK